MLSCSIAWGISVPWKGIKPTSPALQSGVLTTGPPGNSQNSPFTVKIRFCIWPVLQSRKRHKTYGVSWDLRSNIFFIQRVTLTHYWVTPKLLVLSGAQTKRGLCNESRLLFQPPHPSGHVVQETRWGWECQQQIGMLHGGVDKPLRVDHSSDLWDFGAKPWHLLQITEHVYKLCALSFEVNSFCFNLPGLPWVSKGWIKS